MEVVNMKRYTAAEVIANHICWDIADVKEHRYHYGHTSKPVFSFTGFYMCATSGSNKPPQHRDYGDIWEWTPIKSSFAEGIGWTIWEMKV
jgi:hypothetical protein